MDNLTPESRAALALLQNLCRKIESREVEVTGLVTGLVDGAIITDPYAVARTSFHLDVAYCVATKTPG